MSRHTVLHVVAVIILALIVLIAVRLHSAAAATIDPHALYEAACSKCHSPHAVDLVRSSMRKIDGDVVANEADVPIAKLLARHGGTRLTADEIMALTRHFEQMLSTGFLFQEKCIVCHDRASEFARLSLVIRDGKLVGRYSGRDIAAFLTEHGRLTPAEAETMTATLARQLAARDDWQQRSAPNESK